MDRIRKRAVCKRKRAARPYGQTPCAFCSFPPSPWGRRGRRRRYTSFGGWRRRAAPIWRFRGCSAPFRRKSFPSSPAKSSANAARAESGSPLCAARAESGSPFCAARAENFRQSRLRPKARQRHIPPHMPKAAPFIPKNILRRFIPKTFRAFSYK